MRLQLFAVTAFALSGCAILGPPPAHVIPKDQVLAGYRAYAFRPVSELVQRVGAPAGSTVVAGSKVYLWEQNSNTAAIDPRLAPVPLHCELQVFVDSKELVQNVFLNGNDGACELFTLD
jgi:hypothetical protein